MTEKDRTGQDWTGKYNTWSLEIQPVDRFTWTVTSRGGRQGRTRQDRKMGWTGQDRTGQDRTGKWAGQHNTCSLEIQPVDRFTWTMASRCGRQDRTGQDWTGLENGLDNTIPEAWRSSQLRASHGPWFRRGKRQDRKDRTGLNRTGDGLDSTIPEAWRSSQLIASHGPWPGERTLSHIIRCSTMKKFRLLAANTHQVHSRTYKVLFYPWMD